MNKNVEQISDSKTSFKIPAADLSALYYPEGTLFQGMNGEGGMYNAAFIYGKGFADVKFVNASTGATSYEWSANGEPLPDTNIDAQGNASIKYALGWVPILPQVKAIAGAQSATYKYGDNLPADVAGAAFVGCDTIYYMSPLDVLYSNGFYVQTGASPYYFGSGTIAENVISTGVGVTLNKPHAPLTALSMGFHLYSKGNTLIPTGEPLTLTIYPINSNDEVDWEKPITSSKIYAEDLTRAFQFSDGTRVYYAKFGFVEYDEVTGLETEKPITLKNASIAVLSWDTTKAFDFGVLFADSPHYPSIPGSSIIFGSNDRVYAMRDQDGIITADISFVIEGLYNTFDVMETTNRLTAPIGGGLASYEFEGNLYNDVDIYSSFDAESGNIWIEDRPDWVEVSFDQQYYAENRVLLFFVKADALPAGISGRSGSIVLTSLGTTATIYVKQGDAEWPATGISAPQSVESISVVRQGDDFKLSYPAVATSVSVYNVTGQRVGEYKLNVDGKYTLSTANLTNGIYILKFNGTNQAVKIIK
jgi:hypothetical protein